MAGTAEQLDSTIDVVTPENIAFTYRIAGPFRRMPAFLIDLALRAFVFGVVVGALLIGLGSFGAAGGMIAIALILLTWFGLSWFYGGIFETYMNGQTPGKWLMGIRVLTVEGQPINGMQAVMRNILREADIMPMVSVQALGIDAPLYIIPTFIAGLVAMSMSGRFQRLGDLVCGTVVVVEERPWLMGVARVEDPRAAQLAEFLPTKYEVSRSLARTLATYVERRRFFSPARRREIARHLGEPLLRQFGLPADTSHDLLLCALYYRVFIADRPEASANPFAAPPPWAATAPMAPPLPPPLPQQQMAGMQFEELKVR